MEDAALTIVASLRDGLEIELPKELLVPTVVQTFIYGLFAAWLESDDPQDFQWVDASYRLSMPVYADMLHEILTPAFVRTFGGPGTLAAAARVLTWVDRDAFNTAFEGGAIEYFYEPFLAQFDPDLRDRLGVWYTPAAIADYQVARVDHHLRIDLGIERGLADPSVVVLDPAVGTGTYLAAVLRHIHGSEMARGEPASIAAEHARAAVRDRLIGFEVLPAAYVVAHINLARHLHRIGAPLGEDERARVYLANALTGWGKHPKAPPPMPLPDLEAELKAALHAKTLDKILVVLGNPPYEGYSPAETPEEKALLAPWITGLWEHYGVRKHRLGDLYVRFWRLGVQRIAGLTGRGIVCFITNRKWLGGRSAPLMRHTVVTDFDTVIVDDLHGDVHEAAKGDESVFLTKTATGIQVGTAIVTAVRTTGTASDEHPAGVWGRDLYGSATDKHTQLRSWATAQDQTVAMTEHLSARPVSRASSWRLTAGPTTDNPGIDEYLSFGLSGVQPVLDAAVTSTDRDALAARMREYFDNTIVLENVLQRHPGFAGKRTGYDAAATRKRLLAGSGYRNDRLVRCTYRPMDMVASQERCKRLRTRIPM